MKINKLISILLLIIITVCPLASCSTDKGSIVLDKDGALLCHITSFKEGDSDAEDPYLNAYVDIVKSEAVKIIAAQNQTDEAEAEKYIQKNCLTINTCFDRSAYEQLKKAAEDELMADCSVGISATDINGGLLAVYSKSTNGDYVNLATAKTAPYSAIKPLSVYAPAIDSGVVNWGTLTEDSPVKKVTDESGMLRDWPSNATDTYSMDEVSLKTAVMHSLNTVAVKTLTKFGVKRSVAFMEKAFDIDLTYEKSIADSLGEDEILSAIALGYMNVGVSPVDMSGHYQIFANCGKYTKPYTVTSILSADGVELYNEKKLSKYNFKKEIQVIQPSTAFIMNKLLQSVVSPDGTGNKAYVSGLPIAAKTGTGTSYQGNWFIGVTPAFCISVWHDNGIMKNRAAEVFKNAADGFPAHDGSENTTDFPACNEVSEEMYCTESGLLAGNKCPKREKGYFSADFMPKRCNCH